MSKTNWREQTETVKKIHDDGTEETTVKQTAVKFASGEPDYIKIYTRMWCEFNGVPEQWRALFLALIVRMSYANSAKPEESQIVYTYGPTKDAIMRELGWKTRSPLQKGLRELTKCGAIRRVARACYQVNPHFAGRGGWKYDAKKNQGGIEDLIATFDFATKDVKTEITWADDGEDTDFNQTMREGLGVKASDNTKLTYTTMKPKEVSE